MSPRGWPKGKPRPQPISEARRAADRKLAAAGQRARYKRKLQAAELSSGRKLNPGPNDTREYERAHLDTTPAVWSKATHHIGEYEYVDNGLDEIMLRALRERVVYAQSVCCHREAPLQELTIETIAAVEKHHRKMEKGGRDPRKPSLPLPTKDHLTKKPLSAQQLRIIGLLAAGLSAPEIGRKLGVKERTVKMHCDVLRAKLGAETRRGIPMAYRAKTGKDPFTLIPGKAREGPPLTTVVKEMFASEPAPGKTLIDVVSEMFDS